ncbi:MAG: sodium:alanine symporter family protein [Bacteroidota bacterium]|jgi:AGCS family alanine or glycine:cation symporter|nr:sodium:alanine symporter family protein [Flammeovirgaceae bacterium]MEC7245073.1 sodium:alanine symporter family protein [Bacteroidota bacterium]MEC7851533.1 sodium:alanine symporter family protein [Bacteroidota bacterium]MEC8679489.1 sodium:alanine symporter family protein [Bacteroidota bacterium]MEC8702267.1 sodium:alanine symporter family protein [Bacteroidota bacterium]|tara:strand:- start:3677 stop:5374 length:1698 start_codon:yes stop_codon:yes gene_type:complete
MQEFNEFLIFIDQYLGSSSWFVPLLLGTGVFFTFYLKFPQIRYFGFALKVVRGKFDKKDDQGDTSHFQALTTALSGTVGTGNIAGVAFAIHLGGPAALFWMLATAMVGMTTKFVEVTLSHKYREKISDGSMSGGPMYFMKNADFRLFGNKVNLKWVGIMFAFATVLSSFGTGSLPQINSISNSMFSSFGIDKMLTGGILAILLGVVIIGGIKRIASITEKLVPFMAVVYIIGAFSVIIFNYQNIVPSFISIFSEVFSGSAAVGGFLGASISFAISRGVNRGLYSNEAGQGSAPIAHASAKTNEPVSEGLVAILEPFIDTIIICTITGLVLLSSGVWNEKHENTFAQADLIFLDKVYTEDKEEDVKDLFNYLNGNSGISMYSGNIDVIDGRHSNEISILHARSLAEDILFYNNDEEVFNGTLNVVDGKLQNDLIVKGKSLVHSAPLTAIAFDRGFFGNYGNYIVSIGLLLFAFSTAISWSYYGDRAMTFLFGAGSVVYYRVIYVIGFFVASFADTTVIWNVSLITIALMTVPNLIGLLWLRKEVKSTISKYWVDFKKEWPNEKTPE